MTFKQIATAIPAILGLVGLLATATSCSTKPADEPLSLWLAHSEMERVPLAINLDFQDKPKWDYSASVELVGMLKVADAYGDEALLRYARQWADTMINAQGEITCYDPKKYNIDHICPGKFLMRLYESTGDERYTTAAASLMAQAETHPRTSEGGYWHKKVYPHQMWLDGLYMGAPFITEYAARNKVQWTVDGRTMTSADICADMARQFLIVGRHTHDDSTHLFRHAWDESRQMFWADSISGRSLHAWGRANGWYMMGMVDALEYMPKETAGRDSLQMLLNQLAESLLTVRDPETGMWFQVLDCPGREGNFIESSCSAMFIYSMLKGARLGLLPEKYRSIGEEAFCKYVAAFVGRDDAPDGSHQLLSIRRCCAVAGLGGKDMRSGTFDYYIHEKMRDNDPKSIGPFLLACVELGM